MTPLSLQKFSNFKYASPMHTQSGDSINLSTFDTGHEFMSENNHYGECRDCGEDIHYWRLPAPPFSKRCVRCQALYERLQTEKKYALI